MIDQSRKSSRMRVRFRDGGPPIGGTTAWDASGWLTPRLDLPNFLSDRRIHHGDDAERDPHHAHRHRQGGRGSQEVHGHVTPETAGLRVGVLPGGCSGFRYSLSIEDKPAADDIVI